MKNALFPVFLAFIVMTLTGCGVGANPRPLYSSALLERQCRKNTVPEEAVTKTLASLYNEFLTKSPMSYLYIPEKLYDYKTPLVINLSDLEAKVKIIKNQMKDEAYMEANYTMVALEVYNLYQNALRLEGVKCQRKYLEEKKSQDITSYMYMKNFCLDKNNAELCAPDSLLNLGESEVNFVKGHTVAMCELLTGNGPACALQYSVETQNEIQERFRDEKFNKLFKLKEAHLKFNCTKVEDQTTMAVQVLSLGWERAKLEALTAYVSEAWSKNNFKLVIELVTTKTANVIQIIPTNRSVSYVVDNDNHQVYLSQLIDLVTQKRVMAHEFGHVLGFPDCYTEFYDKKKKSLIYYEISKENTNIMCSLKNGVSVAPEYVDQLAQKSCLFK